MKSIMTLITILFLATSAFAAEISEADVKTFLNEWLAAQNTGSYSNYAAIYADNFTGIRRTGTSTYNLNRENWLKDRKKMFKKKMVVEATDPEIKLAGTTASVKFEQTWASGTYKDKGDKLLNLALENGKLKITREEMLFSKVISEIKSEVGSFHSVFTSLKNKDCKKIQSDSMISALGSDAVVECPAPNGWRLFVEYDHEEARSWIRLSFGGVIWSTLEQVWNDDKYEFGHFPNVNSPKAEWRISTTGEPSALIFRVNAQNPENSSLRLTRLFVVSLTNHKPRFCGMAKTNEDARELADNATNCTPMLNKITLPKQ
ncbi:MAG: nuclear transport factor 2 family protein [Geobacter sp.]|nr:MAG: nuclear transport factor 2 family protein [Geobacter sp.]